MVGLLLLFSFSNTLEGSEFPAYVINMTKPNLRVQRQQ